jgi:hypothetical protein
MLYVTSWLVTHAGGDRLPTVTLPSSVEIPPAIVATIDRDNDNGWTIRAEQKLGPQDLTLGESGRGLLITDGAAPVGIAVAHLLASISMLTNTALALRRDATHDRRVPESDVDVELIAQAGTDRPNSGIRGG